MTKDDVMRLAREAGFLVFDTKTKANNPADQILADAVTQHYHDSAFLFAKLVAEHERKQWAKEFAGLGEWSAVHILEERGQA